MDLRLSYAQRAESLLSLAMSMTTEPMKIQIHVDIVVVLGCSRSLQNCHKFKNTIILNIFYLTYSVKTTDHRIIYQSVFFALKKSKFLSLYE